MTSKRTAIDVFQEEFPAMRAKIIEIGAALDRIDRAEGSVADDPVFQQAIEAIGVLTQSEPQRAEKLQLKFSLPYDENWQQSFDSQS